jgi:hypothetical protein
MKVVWKPEQPQLHILKQTATYVIYYTKIRIYSQIVDFMNVPAIFPTLLFENGIYVGPPHDLFVYGTQYNDEEITWILQMDCQRFQHPSLRKLIWYTYG